MVSRYWVRNPGPLTLLLVFALFLPVRGQNSDFIPALERYESQESGEFASGELKYIADGKDLGSESYSIKQSPGGRVEITSEGVVTPPIPIPFIKPKIKFNQEITLSPDLLPESLFLQYNGPLGIGNQKISIIVEGNTAKAEIGNDEKEAVVDPEKSFFSGIGVSQALFAFILAKRDGQVEFTEIRSGGSGPQGADDRLKVDIRLQEKAEVSLDVAGRLIGATEYTFAEEGSETIKSIIAADGTFLAFVSKDPESPFYIYRSDILGEDFTF